VAISFGEAAVAVGRAASAAEPVRNTVFNLVEVVEEWDAIDIAAIDEL
jgi:hypothetical protein